jgi:hypothetical protein
MNNKMKTMILVGVGFGVGFLIGKEYVINQVTKVLNEEKENLKISMTERTDDMLKSIRDSHSSGAVRRQPYTFDIPVFVSIVDAEDILNKLVDTETKYGHVTVADLYDFCGKMNGNFKDYKYGWKNIDTASISRTRDGYVLNLPRVTVVN